MTEEIINGINVVKCEFFNDCECKLYKQEYWERTDTTFDFCKEHPLCEYKATAILERLEQENRELKAYKDVNEDFKKAWDELNRKHTEVLKLAKENADSNEYCLQELEKENKELIYKINQLKANSLYNDLTGIERSAKVFELEQENKDLKKQIESQKGLITVGGKQQYEMTMAYDKCKSALEEIREIAEKSIKISYSLEVNSMLYDIKHKINEVLGDN